MPRIIVIADTPKRSQGSVLLDELVHPVHLSTGHAAAQLIERLAWAINDAEALERTRSRRAQSQQPSKLAHEPSKPSSARQPIAA
jgi:hypothetical protein